MINNRVILFFAISLTLSCSFNTVSSKEDLDDEWPSELTSLPIGLKVVNSPEVIYPSLNTKNPEQYKYQLAFETEVFALHEDLEIVDFGGYIWRNNEWVFQTMYDRPFNREEFIKWYGSINGEILMDSVYADRENWLTKTNDLNGLEIRLLNYFTAKNKDGKKFYGASEVTGYLNKK